MMEPILMKVAAWAAGMASTGLLAHVALKLVNRMDWEPVFAAAEAAGRALSRLGDMKFTASTWEPIEALLEEKVETVWARFKLGLDLDDSGEAQNAKKEGVNPTVVEQSQAGTGPKT